MKDATTPAKMFAASLLAASLQFAVAIVLLGGWKRFASHSSLLTLMVVTLAMLCVAPFSHVNLSSGEKEDRANRWVFIAFSVIAIVSAVIPPYTDRVGLWTIDGETTRWIGVPSTHSVACCACTRLHARPAFQRIGSNSDPTTSSRPAESTASFEIPAIWE